MISRRAFLLSAGAALPLSADEKFSSAVGLQLYSLRRPAQKDLPNTLALVRKLGFQELEVGGFYGRTAAEFRQMLTGNGLKATSMIAGWDQLLKSTNEVADQARTLGVEYVSCTSIPRKKKLTLEDVTIAANNFNRWGDSLRAAELRFCFHPHGPEFVSGPDGTLFDTMAKLMEPTVANFEMDVFWFVFGNQDPARMLERYSGRFPLMHVKDIRKGEPRTFNPGTVAEEASVPLGKGEVDWPSVLRAARKTGVRKYYIEEEHPDAVNQIEESLRYLRSVRF
jgi:sugar phosphate isomerase/epimerase